METEFRLQSQRKEIERLREEALARNAVIGKLQADKVALSEMLNRALEILELHQGYEWDAPPTAKTGGIMECCIKCQGNCDGSWLDCECHDEG